MSRWAVIAVLAVIATASAQADCNADTDCQTTEYCATCAQGTSICQPRFPSGSPCGSFDPNCSAPKCEVGLECVTLAGMPPSFGLCCPHTECAACPEGQSLETDDLACPTVACKCVDSTAVVPEGVDKPDETVCGLNEIVTDCFKPCEETCEGPSALPCEDMPCVAGCICAENYIRFEGGCIPTTECNDAIHGEEGCPSLSDCAIACSFGLKLDEETGCSVCECAESPSSDPECPTLNCDNVECEIRQIDEMGCETCECENEDSGFDNEEEEDSDQVYDYVNVTDELDLLEQNNVLQCAMNRVESEYDSAFLISKLHDIYKSASKSMYVVILDYEETECSPNGELRDPEDCPKIPDQEAVTSSIRVVLPCYAVTVEEGIVVPADEKPNDEDEGPETTEAPEETTEHEEEEDTTEEPTPETEDQFGGFTEGDITDEQVVLAAHCGLAEVNKQSNALYTQVVHEVLEVNQKVVAGMNYIMLVGTGTSSQCRNDGEIHLEADCPIDTNIAPVRYGMEISVDQQGACTLNHFSVVSDSDSDEDETNGDDTTTTTTEVPETTEEPMITTEEETPTATPTTTAEATSSTRTESTTDHFRQNPDAPTEERTEEPARTEEPETEEPVTSPGEETTTKEDTTESKQAETDESESGGNIGDNISGGVNEESIQGHSRSNDKSKDGSKTSTGVLLGVVAGCVLIIAAVALIAYRRKQSYSVTAPQFNNPNADEATSTASSENQTQDI